MKITQKILSIPPYISTTWQHIASLKMENHALVITLTSKETVTIPNLPAEAITQIFEAHANYLEKLDNYPKETPLTTLSNLEASLGNTEDNSFRFGINLGDGFGTVMQHNPEQKMAPDLPPEMLERIAMIAKIVSPEEIEMIPAPETDCNCMYCQLARAIRGAINKKSSPLQLEGNEEDIVSDEELNFCQWDIVSLGNNLYTVTNRLDNHETYNVFLGEPVGCTCGKSGCEHVVAVLRH